MTNRQSMLLEIAEAFGTLEGERTGRQAWLARLGICHSVSAWGETHWENMMSIVSSYCTWPLEDSRYLWCTLGAINDTYRSTLCCLLAAMSDEDYDELVENARRIK